MPITSLDYLMKRSTNGFTYKSNFIWNTGQPDSASGAATLTQARTYDCFYSGQSSGVNFRGISGENTYPATNGARTWVSCNSSSSFAIAMPFANTVASNETIHITSATAITTSSSLSLGYFTLIDLQGYWPNVVTTTLSSQSLTGTPGSTLRYTNGEGCRLYCVQTTAFTGVGAPNIGSLTYTNQAGTTGRNVASSVVGINFGTGGGVPLRQGCVPHSFVSTPTSNNCGQFLPTQGNDTGVQNVASFTNGSGTASTAGAFVLCLGRPILHIPVVARSTFIEQDYVYQYPTLPEVKRNACLILTYTPMNSVANSQAFYGQLDFVWG